MRQGQVALFVTPGEPAGIGPDLLLRMAAAGPPPGMVAVADAEALRIRAKLLGIDVKLTRHEPGQDDAGASRGVLPVWQVPLPRPEVCGTPSEENSPALLQALRTAAAACIESKGALVTGPLQKSAMLSADPKFVGHTGYLANLCDRKGAVMLFVSENIKLALATVHLPLAAVSKAISKQKLVQVIMTLEYGLTRWFGIDRPRIKVLGLNPHAGEQGLFGNEEARVIEPAILEARRGGISVHGPAPADTAFVQGFADSHDAILSMYHDQALPAAKALAFGKLANVTLGLPFLRTSVDHGTALGLAGSGEVNDGGFRTAVEVALACAGREHGRVSIL